MATTTPKTFKVKVAMTLIKSQNVYKGPFETVDELDSVQALNGDYADVYETGTRWQYVTDTWTNTNKLIPVDKQYAQMKDVSVAADSNTIAKRDEDGHLYAVDGEALQHVVTVNQLQNAEQAFQQALANEQDARIDEDAKLQTALNTEIERSTGKDASLESSIQGLDDSITAENVRAKAAEEQLQQNIDATNTALQQEVQRAKLAENTNEQAIETEQNARIAADNKLTQDLNDEVNTRTSQVTSVTKAINDESLRAQTVEEELSSSVATKLTQVVAQANKLRTYTVETDGASSMTDIDSSVVSNTIVQRTSNGNVKTAAPVADDDAASKKYVDDVDNAHQTRLQTLENELADEISRATTAEGVLADSIDEEVVRAKNAEAANAANISKNTTSIDNIKKLIPNTASEENQLTDKDFVNSSIANNASNFVTPSASGDSQFASLAALQAGPWYLRGQSYIPTKNDYAIYINTDQSVWRAVHDGQFWVAAYKVNDTPFTAEQVAALNSGVTAQLLATIATDIANRVVASALVSMLYATDADGNQVMKAISDFATAAQGAKADSAYQKPSSGIPQTDLNASVQQALELAKTALQSFTEQDPTVPAWAKNSTKPAYTKSEVGLSNVDNTSDADKPVSTKQRAAIDAVQGIAETAQNAIDTHIANKDNPHAVTAAQVGAEPAFTKNSAFNKAFGTTAGTVCQGNDSRLSNSRTPTSHASTATTYGVGSSANYGHVQLSGDDSTGTNDNANTAERYHYVSQTSVDLNNFRSEGNFTLYNATTRTNFPSKATVPSTPTYYLEVKRMYSNTAVVQLLFVRGTNEIWIRYSTSETSWGAWTKVGDAATPYTTNLSTTSWSGSDGAYTYAIAASTHGKGAYPQVRTFVSNEECYDSPIIDANGNVTLKSNTNVAMRVVIY